MREGDVVGIGSGDDLVGAGLEALVEGVRQPPVLGDADDLDRDSPGEILTLTGPSATMRSRDALRVWSAPTDRKERSKYSGASPAHTGSRTAKPTGPWALLGGIRVAAPASRTAAWRPTGVFQRTSAVGRGVLDPLTIPSRRSRSLSRRCADFAIIRIHRKAVAGPKTRVSTGLKALERVKAQTLLRTSLTKRGPGSTSVELAKAFVRCSTLAAST